MPGSSAATRSFTVRGLEGDVEHGFRIRAVGYGGDGPVSNIATATPEQASTTPEFDTRTVADQHYTQNVPIPTLQLPHATGGDGTVRYTLAHELPAGLRFNASTRQITGTPTAIQPATIYTYSATDEDYDRATLAFTIEVAADTAPSFADATIADRSWSQGRAAHGAASGGERGQWHAELHAHARAARGASLRRRDAAALRHTDDDTAGGVLHLPGGGCGR